MSTSTALDFLNFFIDASAPSKAVAASNSDCRKSTPGMSLSFSSGKPFSCAGQKAQAGIDCSIPVSGARLKPSVSFCSQTFRSVVHCPSWQRIASKAPASCWRFGVPSATALLAVRYSVSAWSRLAFAVFRAWSEMSILARFSRTSASATGTRCCALMP
ncbi:hypothetical protein CGZ96_11245 [Enemella evansiae]|nr:hypothetical protein CGZ96_11245 [Enemella evansiae]